MKAKKTTKYILITGGTLLLAVGGFLAYKKWIKKPIAESESPSGGGGSGGMTEKSTVATTPNKVVVNTFTTSRNPLKPVNKIPPSAQFVKKPLIQQSKIPTIQTKPVSKINTINKAKQTI